MNSPVRTKPFPAAMPGASLIGEEELKELTDVVREQSPFRHYGIGNPVKVSTFEQKFREYFGARFALAVSSGSAAILCAVAAIGLGPGDEVIIPCFSWYSDYCGLVALGVTPVFADIGEDLDLDPEDFERKITGRTKAVIVVHYQGHPADMDKISRIAHKHKLIIIEDCAQAIGGTFQGKKLGSFGDIAIASFQTHKILTCGEGGIVWTNNEAYFERAVRYHDLGFVRPAFAQQLDHPENADPSRAFAGLQLRMSELQGAFLCAQMDKLPRILENCRRSHGRLVDHVRRSYPGKFTIRYKEGDCGIAFIVLMKDKETADLFGKMMNDEGIPCGATSACCNLMEKEPISTMAMPNSKLPPFYGSDISYDPKTCPNADGIVSRVVAIPVGPLYTDQDVDDIITAFDKTVRNIPAI